MSSSSLSCAATVPVGAGNEALFRHNGFSSPPPSQTQRPWQDVSGLHSLLVLLYSAASVNFRRSHTCPPGLSLLTLTSALLQFRAMSASVRALCAAAKHTQYPSKHTYTWHSTVGSTILT
jgi:hypothetical protein